jgi:hypothetical protein
MRGCKFKHVFYRSPQQFRDAPGLRDATAWFVRRVSVEDF